MADTHANETTPEFGWRPVSGRNRGVRKDGTEVARWYRKAAEEGCLPAQAALGSAYAEGRGMPRDYVQAWLWLSLAGRTLQNAQAIRDRIEARMAPVQIVEAQRLSREWTPKLR